MMLGGVSLLPEQQPLHLLRSTFAVGVVILARWEISQALLDLSKR